MKRILCIALAALLFGGCAARSYEGPTQETTVLAEYYYENYWMYDEVSYSLRTVYAYDTWGNLVEERDYRDDELQRVTKYTYDENGNLLQETRIDHTGWFPKESSRTESTYDEQNRCQLSVTYQDGAESSRIAYTYDDAAHTKTLTYSDGAVVTYYYDEAGLLLREHQTSSDASYQESETVYTYDKNGNQTAWHNYIDGVLDTSVQREFDGQGRETYAARYDENGQVQHTWRYEYDEGRGTVTTTYTDKSTRVEYYGQDGKLSRVEQYDANGELSSFQTYTYRQIQVPLEEEE